MIQTGVVQELIKGEVKVAVGGGAGCDVCASKESCVAITGTRPEEKVITAAEIPGISVGDVVELELPVTITMQIIFITLVLPVILLIVGYFIMLERGPMYGAIGAFSGLVAGLIIAVSANRTMGKRPSYRMRITKIVAKCTEREVTE
jgi:positive regulator of sigma E activity